MLGARTALQERQGNAGGEQARRGSSPGWKHLRCLRPGQGTDPILVFSRCPRTKSVGFREVCRVSGNQEPTLDPIWGGRRPLGRPSSAFQDYIPHGRQAGSAGTLLTHSLDGWRRNRHPQMLLRAEMPALRHGMDGALSRKGPALHLYTPGNPSLRDPAQRRGQPAPAAAVSPRAIGSQASRAIPQLHHVPFRRRRPRPAQLQIRLVLARALILEQTQVSAPIRSSPADAMKPLPEALPEASPPAGIPSLLAPWASREGSGGAGRQAGKGDSLALMQKALDHTEHPHEGLQHPRQHTPVPGWALAGARMGSPTVNPPAGEPAGTRGSELAPASWLLLPWPCREPGAACPLGSPGRVPAASRTVSRPGMPADPGARHKAVPLEEKGQKQPFPAGHSPHRTAWSPQNPAARSALAARSVFFPGALLSPPAPGAAKPGRAPQPPAKTQGGEPGWRGRLRGFVCFVFFFFLPKRNCLTATHSLNSYQ